MEQRQGEFALNGDRKCLLVGRIRGRLWAPEATARPPPAHPFHGPSYLVNRFGVSSSNGVVGDVVCDADSINAAEQYNGFSSSGGVEATYTRVFPSCDGKSAEKLCYTSHSVTWAGLWGPAKVLATWEQTEVVTLPPPVLCKFQPSGPAESFLVAMTSPEAAVVYGPRGSSDLVTFPCACSLLVPMDKGLLVQASASGAGTGDNPDPNEPTIFTLGHPLDEVKPLGLAQGGMMCDASESLVHFCTVDPCAGVVTPIRLVVTHNLASGLHTIWRMETRVSEAAPSSQARSSSRISDTPGRPSSPGQRSSPTAPSSPVMSPLAQGRRGNSTNAVAGAPGHIRRGSRHLGHTGLGVTSPSLRSEALRSALGGTSPGRSRAPTMAESLGSSGNLGGRLAETIPIPKVLGASKLQPDYVLHPLWCDRESAAQVAPAEDVFLLRVRTVEGAETVQLCIVTSQGLRAFMLLSRDGKEEIRGSRLIPGVVCAVGLHAMHLTSSQEHKISADMLALMMMGDGPESALELVLFRGFEPVCGVDCSGLPARPVRVKDAVGNEVTLELEDGSAWRMCIPCGGGSALASEVFRSLHSTLSSPRLAAQLQLDAARAKALVFARSSPEDPDWSAIVMVMETLLAGHSSISRGNDQRGSAWDHLLSSEFHSICGASLLPRAWRSAAAPRTDLADGMEAVAACELELLTKVQDVRHAWYSIVKALQMLHEDIRILRLEQRSAWRLASLLLSLSKALRLSQHEHYFMQCVASHPDAASMVTLPASVGGLPTELPDSSFPSPTCIFDWVRWRLIHTGSGPWEGSSLPSSVSRTVAQLLGILSDGSGDTGRRLVCAMADANFSTCDLELLSMGVRLPLVEALHTCKSGASHDWPASAQKLVDRQDLLALRSSSSPPSSTAEPRTHQGLKNAHESLLGSKDDMDGLIALQSSTRLRFPLDLRVKEVCRLLQSSRPPVLQVDRPPEVSDHEYLSRQQYRLLLLCMRAWAAPAGRGMITLASMIPLLAEPIPIPPLCLAGRVYPSNVSLALDLSAVTDLGPQLMMWPHFHNGVATGLRLPAVKRHDISRTWILYNKPPSFPSAGQRVKLGTWASYGGLLFALGLHKHLSALHVPDYCAFLTTEDDSLTVGTLLGAAAAKRGTAEPSCSKMLCLHIPSLLPPHLVGLEICSIVRMAAISGIGLLYMGTGHRLMTEFLLNEMGKRTDPDRPDEDKDAYTLSLGLALGMVNLGRGGDPGLADLLISRRLRLYVEGGKDPAFDLSSSGPQMSPDDEAAVAATRSIRVSEGDQINTAVTGPGATLALGLIHLRSNDETVAAWLDLPQTHYALDSVQPDVLMLRIIAKGLIMWDSVHATDEWVQRQIPSVVQQEIDRLGQPLPDGLVGIVDKQSIRQAHAYIIAGSCMVLGLRFAGTGDEEAKKVVMSNLGYLKSLREVTADVKSAPDLMLRVPERHVINTCCATASIGLSMVMAGSGCIESLRILRELRWRVDSDVPFGIHMAFSQAIGLLFLQGGMASLSRSNEGIAALVTAFYPRFPSHSADNHFHLQPLRHLYAIAVVQNRVQVVDVDSGEPLSVPVQLRFSGPQGRSGWRNSGKMRHLMTTSPFCLPNGNANDEGIVTSIIVKSPEHFQTTLHLNRSSSDGLKGCLYVKARSRGEPWLPDASGILPHLLYFKVSYSPLPPPCIYLTGSTSPPIAAPSVY
jgi:hypothetical protein